MDPDDRGYIFLRWFLRTPVMVFVGRHIPEFMLRWISATASAQSRQYTTEVKVASEQQVRDKVRRHARTIFLGETDGASVPFEILVSGHVHVAMDFTEVLADGRSFRCINLGTWLKSPQYLEVLPHDMALRPLKI